MRNLFSIICLSCCVVFFAVFGLIILIGGIIVTFVVVPPIVERLITESVILDADGSDQYKRWETTPIPFLFKVTFFNVTNVDIVQAGGVPIVQEIGPYVYRQSRQKYEIERDSEAGTLSYFQRQLYHFAEDLSNGLQETDQITVLHPSMNGVLQQAEFQDIDRMPIVNAAVSNIFNVPTSMFLTTSVKDILFDGVPLCVNPNIIARVICRDIMEAGTSTMRPVDDGSLLFSFFHHKNNTNDGRFTVKDGSGAIDDLARIVLWNNETRLSIWEENDINNSVCNDINGTDSSVFPPFVSAQQLQVFTTDICRSVNIHYEKDDVYEGIVGRKYVNREDMLSNNENCFCDQSSGCFKSGAMDLYPCLMIFLTSGLMRRQRTNCAYQGLELK